MENISNADFLATTMKATGLDWSGLAEASGYSERTLKRIASGEVKLSRFVRQSLESLAENGIHPVAKIGKRRFEQESSVVREEPLPRNRRAGQIPLIGWAQAGAQTDFEDVVEWEQYIQIPNDDPKAIAIRVRGDSMMPEIHDGDIVIVAPSYPPLNGKPVVARTKDGVVLKNYRRVPGEKHQLASANQLYPPVVIATRDMVWIYPVVAVIHFP